MSVAIFVVLAIALLIFVSGGYVFFEACLRQKEPNWLEEKEVEITPYAKYYSYILLSDRFLREHGVRDVYVESEDGLKLHGLWIAAENPKGTIILAHGYRSTKLVDFGLVFELYHNLGMNILAPDQRAHGKSEGKYITFGVKESKDIQSWVAYHNRRYGDLPVILSGLSMGASTVLYLADADLPENVKGIIADCGFTTPREIIGSVFRRVTHLPAAIVLWAADLFARVFAGFRMDEKDTRKTLQGSKLPVLMVHGTDDGFVPCEMSVQGYEACRGEKELLLVEGADHGVSFLVDRPRYEEAVRAFLRKNVEGINELRNH